ncbi:hypothetical protein ACFO3O_21900 [Dokdonia ponticola]|uniref:Uncharacterized protein n=1 Tax=Dokdonia ponticola TaxID=2041041 RepID=A0ABV9I534_9FLAO
MADLQRAHSKIRITTTQTIKTQNPMKSKEEKKKKDISKVVDMDGIEVVPSKMLIYETVKEKNADDKIDLSVL